MCRYGCKIIVSNYSFKEYRDDIKKEMDAPSFEYKAKAFAKYAMNKGNLTLLEKLEMKYPDFDLGFQPKFQKKNENQEPELETTIIEILKELPPYANDVGKFIHFLLERWGPYSLCGNYSSVLQCRARSAAGYDLRLYRTKKQEWFNIFCDCLLPHFFKLGKKIGGYQSNSLFFK